MKSRTEVRARTAFGVVDEVDWTVVDLVNGMGGKLLGARRLDLANGQASETPTACLEVGVLTQYMLEP